MLTGSAPVQIVSDPPGEVVYLFRLTELPERRVVPVPWRDRAAVAAALDGSFASHFRMGVNDDGASPGSCGTPAAFGSHVLRVVRGVDDIRPGDLLLDIAGFPIGDLVLVTECPPSSDVQRFDRLQQIDGIPVRDEYQARWLGGPRAHNNGTPREFTFERDGQQFDLHGEWLALIAINAACRAFHISVACTSL